MSTTTSNADDCLGTVAYGFLTRDTLPLWPAWEQYFARCPAGSAIPIIHSQDSATSRGVRAEVYQMLVMQQGLLVPPGNTIQGNPRFKWKMVEMMFSIFRLAAQAVASNGCTPRHIHMLSERDAPIASCVQVHEHLRSRPRINFADQSPSPYISPAPVDLLPAQFVPMDYSSQWVTLWVEHAEALAAADEHGEMHAKWQPLYEQSNNHYGLWAANRINWGSFDEYVWVTELTQRGFEIDRHGLTHTWWCEDQGATCDHADAGDGSPAAYLDSVAVQDACRIGRARGYFFTRKVGNGEAGVTARVLEGLASSSCLGVSIAGSDPVTLQSTSIPPAPPPSLPRMFDTQVNLAPPSPPPPSPPQQWESHVGENCYADRGSLDMGTPVSNWFAPTPIEFCKIACLNTPGCNAITVDRNQDRQCYRLRSVMLHNCEHNTGYDTYTLRSAPPPHSSTPAFLPPPERPLSLSSHPGRSQSPPQPHPLHPLFLPSAPGMDPASFGSLASDAVTGSLVDASVTLLGFIITAVTFVVASIWHRMLKSRARSSPAAPARRAPESADELFTGDPSGSAYTPEPMDMDVSKYSRRVGRRFNQLKQELDVDIVSTHRFQFRPSS